MAGGRWRTQWRESWAAFAALTLPGPCPCCQEPLGPKALAGVCLRCWSSLPLRRGPGCPGCDLPASESCARSTCPDCRDDLERAAALTTVSTLLYEGAAVVLHRRLKFGEALELLKPLGARMTAAWCWRGPFHPDLVVAVPPDPLRFGPRRRLTRRLALAVARQLGRPTCRALVKHRPTRSQTARVGAARRQGLQGAFCADAAQVEGRSVLVIDDVCTTGATLRAAAAALAGAGAGPIGALCLARTPLPGSALG